MRYGDPMNPRPTGGGARIWDASPGRRCATPAARVAIIVPTASAGATYDNDHPTADGQFHYLTGFAEPESWPRHRRRRAQPCSSAAARNAAPDLGQRRLGPKAAAPADAGRRRGVPRRRRSTEGCQCWQTNGRRVDLRWTPRAAARPACASGSTQVRSHARLGVACHSLRPRAAARRMRPRQGQHEISTLRRACELLSRVPVRGDESCADARGADHFADRDPPGVPRSFEKSTLI